MQVYIPKIIYSSPTKLPTIEKTTLYYIIHKTFELTATTTEDINVQIDLKELSEFLNNTSIEFIDLKSQMESAIYNLPKINMSFVDNGFHIKVQPIKSIYLDKFSNSLYVEPSQIVVEYLDQILSGNFVCKTI